MKWLAPLALFGGTAFFYYVLHVHLMLLAQTWLKLDVHTYGLTKTWLGAALTIGLLAAPCFYYRRYKAAHPNGWTRYL